MLTDIINKQVFEFSCNAEETARRVQRDIEAHTALQVNSIMSAVFSQPGNDQEYIKIDRLEIDLGDITEFEFGNAEMLTRFREIFSEKINDIRNSRRVTAIKNGDATISPEHRDELELLRSLMQSGDVPWWIDKTNRVDIDAAVQKLIDHEPGSFKDFIEKYIDNPVFLSRLSAQVKPVTLGKMSELVPSLYPTTLKQRLIVETMREQINTLSPDQVKAIRKLLDKPVSKNIEQLKLELTNTLVKIYRMLRQRKQTVAETALAILLPEKLRLIFSGTDDIKSGEVKAMISIAVNALPVLWIELLLHELRVHIKNERTSASALNEMNVLDKLFVTGSDNESAIHTGNVIEQEQPAAFPVNTVRPEEQSTLQENIAPLSVIPISAENNLNEKSIIDQSAIIDNPGELTNLPSIAEQPLMVIEETVDNTQTLPEHRPEMITNKQQFDDQLQDRFNTNADIIAGEELTSELQIPASTMVDERSKKLINLILRKLKSTDNNLRGYLQRLSLKKLENLATLFRQRIHANNHHRQLVIELVNQPAFLGNGALRILANLSFAVAEKKGQPSNSVPTQQFKSMSADKKLLATQTSFIDALKKLPVKDFYTVKDIIQKGSFETVDEKKLVTKLLNKLSPQSLLLLNFLAELPLEEINQLLPAPTISEEIVAHNDAVKEALEPTKSPSKIYIENAGLCLLAPYLHGFFKQLNYLENGQFRDQHFATRAIYLLQYIVSGNNKRPEYLLQLNKLLCAFKNDNHIITNIRVTKKEKTEANTLLEAVIENWKALKNTSVQGLRQSFLQRKGMLIENEAGWTLKVEKKSYDLLLDSLPWGFNIIKLPWMKKMIQVEW